ncbi:MAG TPA: class I SAM-dependent methyltransferase, partial [Candidatus Dependentiae bacterium]|nr:class I SAM-dependent methyltransferase [Candidatus Dependentiae bacterium]
MDYRDLLAGSTKSLFWFKAKNKLVDQLISIKYHKGTDLKILSLGAGTGDDLGIIHQYGKVYVIDVDEDALQLVPNKFCYNKQIADACDLPFEDDFFDLVVSFDVFEHIE